jgi:predicted  nucleic acid-binding Zn-ribbon protein
MHFKFTKILTLKKINPMKKYLLIATVLFAFGCHDYKADVDKLQKEKQDLVSSTNYKDSTLMSYINEINDIENNLSQIEQKQASISENSKTNELKGTQVERINENIRSINELMKLNKDKIAALSKQLKNSNVKIGNFEKMVASLNEQLGEKDKQLADMNTRLESLNTTVDKLNTDVNTLTAQNTDKQKVIEDQTTRLHTAYYTTGTYKELRDKKVVSKEGGFLGIGANKKVQSNFNTSAFNTIDITQTATIPISAKDAVVLTNHPSDSYTIEHKGKTVSDLLITNPEKFWGASKYLVVVVDK